VLFQKISIVHPKKVWEVDPTPLWKFQFNFTLSFNNSGFRIPTSSPLEFVMTFLGVGMHISWNHKMEVKKPVMISLPIRVFYMKMFILVII
jgi:hypothetical protein